VRYLEDCVSKLKSQHDAPAPSDFRLSSNSHEFDELEGAEDPDNGSQEDVEMTSSEAVSPTFTETARSNQPSISPALVAQDDRHRQYSYSSVSTDHRNYSFSTASTTSPAFGPQLYVNAPGSSSASNSTLTSPALMPQPEDQEATAALLMLNADRRGTIGNSGRGMSVRDLLSS
jgi:hypothetical protein